DIEGVAVGILGSRWWSDRVTFDHRVVLPIDLHVQPRAEDVLMDVSDDSRCDLGSVFAGVPRMASGRVDDACRLHLVLDAAILVKIPIRSVLIVPDGRD